MSRSRKVTNSYVLDGGHYRHVIPDHWLKAPVKTYAYDHIRVTKRKDPTRNFGVLKEDVRDRYVTDILKTKLRFLDKGANGGVYSIDARDVGKVMYTLRSRLSAKVHGVDPRPGNTVLVKIAFIERTPNMSLANDWKGFLDDQLREAKIHARLSKATACAKLNGSKVKLCSSTIVPQFHMAGADHEYGVFVTVMSRLHADLLDAHLHKMSARMYVAVEKALVTLWLLGVVHGDAHTANILYNSKSNKAYILDFGMSIVLPPSVKRALRKVVALFITHPGSLANALNALNVKKVSMFINASIARMGYSEYNADGKVLRYLWNWLPTDQRKLVPALRSVAWNTPHMSSPPRAPSPKKYRGTRLAPKRQTPAMWKSNNDNNLIYVPATTYHRNNGNMIFSPR